MGRPAKEPASPSPLAPAIVRWARAQGVGPEALGAPPEWEGADEASLTPSELDRLLGSLAARLGEPAVSLRLFAELSFGRHGLAELASRAATTCSEALARVVKYAPILLPSLEHALEDDGDHAIVRQRTIRSPRGVGRHLHELGLAYALSFVKVAPSRVWFMHARPRDLAPICRFFHTRDVSFGCDDNGLALPRAALDQAIPGGDARLLATVDLLADEALRARPRGPAFVPTVAAHVERLLPAADMEVVARAMRMSARTLQRRLEAENARFSEVLDGVRHDAARRLLSDAALPLAEIAQRLGFADLATFSRAFKRWTGTPPGTFRATRRLA